MKDVSHSLETIFGEAIEIASPQERIEFLDRVCQGNEELRRQAEELVRNYFQAGRFLEVPALESAAAAVNSLLAEQAGAFIGPYKLLQEIGEGGMGVVFMAEQTTPVRRRVALKIIKPGMDSRHVIARFEAERQALAMMDHPHVAKVFDAGTTPLGRPYFVMELVSGHPITEYCDRQNLPIAERLELFTQVCNAVHHAHQKGLVHRDIKPTNILISEHDGRAVAKVIDFGIAKAVDARLTEKTLFTEFQQPIGTPQYMSPEQAGGSLDIDTRSDIYSLGVLLYELLTGATPFDPRELRSKAFEEMQRLIREVDPPTPSTRLSEIKDSLSSVAAQRAIEPRKLPPLLRGELDWITMKALEKDRRRRYESASALAGDVRRYLANEPVIAAAPSRAYRLRKFVRRNKWPVIATTAVLAGLIAGVVGTTAGLVRASRERAEAQRHAANAETVTQFLTSMLSSADPDKMLGEKVTVLQAIQSAIKELDAGQLKNQPLVESEVRGVIGQTLRSLGRFDEAVPQLQRGLELQQNASPSDEAAQADYWFELGILARNQARFREAEDLYRRVLTVRRRTLPSDDERVRAAMGNLSEVLSMQGKFAEAESLARDGVASARRSLPAGDPEIARAVHALATVLYSQGRNADAEPLMREAVQINQRKLPEGSPETAMAMSDLATALSNQAKYAEAEPLFRQSIAIYRKTLPPSHPEIGQTLNNLALLLERRDQPAEAERCYVEALEIFRKSLRPESPDLAACLSNIGLLRQRQGKSAEAEPMLQEALAIERKVPPPGYPFTANTLNALAEVRLDLGAPDDAEPLFRESLEALKRTGTSEKWKEGIVHCGLGRALAALNRRGEAESELLEAERLLATADALAPGYHERAIAALANLYADWDKAEPDKGYGEKSNRWTAKPPKAGESVQKLNHGQEKSSPPPNVAPTKE
jgi:serine/threonine protein kinase/Tfp pilus assembly protein PilF